LPTFLGLAAANKAACIAGKSPPADPSAENSPFPHVVNDIGELPKKTLELWGYLIRNRSKPLSR
jgi:hypothetical protein